MDIATDEFSLFLIELGPIGIGILASINRLDHVGNGLIVRPGSRTADFQSQGAHYHGERKITARPVGTLRARVNGAVVAVWTRVF